MKTVLRRYLGDVGICLQQRSHPYPSLITQTPSLGHSHTHTLGQSLLFLLIILPRLKFHPLLLQCHPPSVTVSPSLCHSFTCPRSQPHPLSVIASSSLDQCLILPRSQLHSPSAIASPSLGHSLPHLLSVTPSLSLITVPPFFGHCLSLSRSQPRPSSL